MSHDWLFETLNAMLDSPITFVAIGLSFSLGLWRGWWWTPAAVALIAGCASALVFYRHWQQLGLNVAWQTVKAMLLFMIFSYPAFAISRAFMRIKSGVDSKADVDKEDGTLD